MADKQPAPSTSSHPHQNGEIGGTGPKRSSPSHQNGHLDRRRQSPGTMGPVLQPPSASSAPASTSTFRCLVSPVPGSGPEGRSSSSRPHSQSPALTSRTRTCAPHIQRSGSQQEEPEALLNLILESQGQRLDDQRANVGLLPDPGPVPLCGTCSHEQRPLPTVDFYYMLINFQSDRMEDQRCPLPDLDDLVGSAPEGQEDFFRLIQRVQSRRMDEQRASLMTSHTEDKDDPFPPSLSSLMKIET